MALTKIDISLMDNTGTTANKLLVYDGSGNLPAVDASQLTGVSTGITESTSDPTISTNPSGGVGSEWVNKTSGEAYICTDATAGENVWTNVGGGSGNIKPYSLAGTQFGYSAGGHTTPTSRVNTIEKYSFTSDGNATDVGDITQARLAPNGNSSETHGYIQGGSAPPAVNVVDKFSFASGGNATDVGDKTQAEDYMAGASNASYGFSSGGNSYTNVIDKTSFSSDANSVDHGDLHTGVHSASGHSSDSYGYSAGGSKSPPNNTDNNSIQKYSMASNSNATDAADITDARSGLSGASSSTDGYVMGGYNYQSPTGYVVTVDKFSFASDTNSTYQRDLNTATGWSGGSSSTTYGYAHGGETSSKINNIQKFAYANSSNGTDVGDLTIARMYLPSDINR